jgi:hypothetical protein
LPALPGALINNSFLIVYNYWFIFIYIYIRVAKRKTLIFFSKEGERKRIDGKKNVTTQVYFRQDLQDKQDYCSFGIFCYAQAGRRAGGFLGHLLSGTEEREGFWSRTW